MAVNRVGSTPWLVAQDWSATRHVTDVGGGNAALLVALLQAHPHLRGTLVELATTAAAAETTLAQAALSEAQRDWSNSSASRSMSRPSCQPAPSTSRS